MKYQAELITIGNELLSGRTINTHAQALGAGLAAIGLELMRDTTIPDNPKTIATAFREALSRTNLLFISGGLGPTIDDITRDALAAELECTIHVDPLAREKLKNWYAQRNRSITPAAERQAQVLEGAEVLLNSVGAAPGQRIDLPGEQTLFILPGPPSEFNAVLNDHIIPWLQQQFPEARPKLVHAVHTRGIGESDIVTRLEKADFSPEAIELGFYPGNGQVEIRLTTTADHQTALDTAEAALRHLLTDFLIRN